MKNSSINLQILMIVMIPVLLIDIILTSVHINSNILQAQQLLETKGEIIAKQIASASEFYLFSGNYEQIQHMLDGAINTNDIIYAAVYSAGGELIAHAEGTGYQSQNSTQYLYYRQAIESQNIVIGDVFEPQIDTPGTDTQTLGWIHMYISKQRLQQNMVDIFTEGLLYFFAMLVVAVVLTAMISKRITRPIFVLLDHLKRVEHDDLGHVIKEVANNEIGEVQNGFNSMSQALLANRMQLNQQIKSATEELMLAISDLEEKNRQLGDARDAAQQANRVKSQFLANISHEIRTPINGIKGFVNLLSQTGLKSNQQRYADIIRQSTNDLTLIINEVLDFSKIESGKIILNDEAFNLYELVESTRDSLATVAMDKGIDLHLTIYSDTPPHLVGDGFRLKQILINLIGNAIKFTDQGFVNITVLLADETDYQCSIQFRIEDSGIGIDETNQQRLFQAFSQIESETNRRYSGTGLGLVISKNLSRLMGGDIELQSDGHSGSVFTLTLPFRPDPSAQTPTNPFNDQTALIYAFDQRCMHELQSLFNRVGFETEIQLVDDGIDVKACRQQLQQTGAYIDLIVFDLRHFHIHPDQLFDADIRQSHCIVIMHYDVSLVEPADLVAHYHFMPIINTSEGISQELQRTDHAATSDDKNGTSASAISRHVLIVDDNPINLALARELVQLWGHQSYTASDANKAIELFEQRNFDLILLDIQMPEVDGVELMTMMRERRPQLTTPVVAITAHVLESEQERLLKLGFDAYLGKPLDERKLRHLLERDQPVSLPQSAAAEEVATAQPVEDISVDVEQSLKLSGNNEQLCLDMLKMLHQSITDYQQQLRQAIDKRSLGKLAYIVHNLQGVTCYTGLPRLKRLLAHYQSIKHLDNGKTFAACEDMIAELSAIEQALNEPVKFDRMKPGSVYAADPA